MGLNSGCIILYTYDIVIYLFIYLLTFIRIDWFRLDLAMNNTIVPFLHI